MARNPNPKASSTRLLHQNPDGNSYRFNLLAFCAMKRITRRQEMKRKFLSIDSLGDWIAEGGKDGERTQTAWEWYRWFRKTILERYRVK